MACRRSSATAARCRRPCCSPTGPSRSRRSPVSPLPTSLGPAPPTSWTSHGSRVARWFSRSIGVLLRQCWTLPAGTSPCWARARGLEVVVELDADLPEVDLDRKRIRQVLGNLVSNAVKFSQQGGRIAIRLERASDAIRCSVEDRGVGIAPDDRPRIFSPFETGQRKPTAGEISTGLGLALCRRIVEAHGGEIWFEDVEGGGTVFRSRSRCRAWDQDDAPEVAQQRLRGERLPRGERRDACPDGCREPVTGTRRAGCRSSPPEPRVAASPPGRGSGSPPSGHGGGPHAFP